MKEFNLSEHLKETEEYGEILFPKRVKEFIRLLKEEFKYETYWQKVCDKINKLAGEKLI